MINSLLELGSNLIKFVIVFIFLYSCGDKKPQIEWIEVKGGTYLMGSPLDERHRKDDEGQRKLLVKPFRMSKYEITVAQFKEFVNTTKYLTDAEKGTGGFKGSIVWTGKEFIEMEGINWRYDFQGELLSEVDFNMPVVHVSWNDAMAFAKWMDCRLPDESEWEYAARAGTTTKFYTGDCLKDTQANYDANFPGTGCSSGFYPETVLVVGSYSANPWGLFDMHGNVAEWCSNPYDKYLNGSINGTVKKGNKTNYVLRGGSWRDNAANCRCARRLHQYHTKRFCFSGIRLVTSE